MLFNQVSIKLNLVTQTNVTHFFTIRINRTSASAIALVWMFSLVSGVANACLLETDGATHASETIHLSQHDERRVSLADLLQTEAGLSGEDGAHTSKQPCLKVRDDISKSLPKKYASGQTEPGSPISVGELWSSGDLVGLQDKRPISAQYAASLRPIRVLYSRLAL